jgi:hypothetical protein
VPTHPRTRPTRRQVEPEEAADDRQQLGEAGPSEPLEELRLMAGLAHTLAVHLQENWPVKGQGPAAGGPPTNVTGTNLYRLLLHLKTLLCRFLPPASPTDDFAWLKSRAPLLKGDVADAVTRIELVCQRLADQFGLQTPLSTVDGGFKCVLTPTLNTAEPWRPPGGGPIPEINPQDVGALEWAAVKLSQTLGGEPAGQAQAAAVPEKPPAVRAKDVQREPKAEARDRWLYARARRKNPPTWKALMADLNRAADKRGWRKLASVQAVQQAVDRYIQRHHLEPLPPRKEA